ncbi:vacuolar protein sorting-associated protein 8 homolog [Neolamprologus brichardi]|uniref:vacuolar protein sorting-associated protein 8 homolog n=1 Tax=Neolamprologus brichardi TaxID=32507 RepID=UPI0003EBFD4E|nr:vacuolar protein sorting-associated protein 8 homolog [Neolamprologus brichardi]
MENVDSCSKVMVDNADFTPSQVGGLFTFLARQLAKPDNTLFVNRKLFDQVLEFLCCPDDDSRHTERQQVKHTNLRLSLMTLCSLAALNGCLRADRRQRAPTRRPPGTGSRHSVF